MGWIVKKYESSNLDKRVYIVFEPTTSRYQVWAQETPTSQSTCKAEFITQKSAQKYIESHYRFSHEK